MASRASKAASAARKTKALKARVAARNSLTSKPNSQGGRDFSINLTETLKFGDKLNAKRSSGGGGFKPVTVSQRGKSAKFALGKPAQTIRINTPESIANNAAKLAAANLNTRIGNRRVAKASVFVPKTVSLPVGITSKPNAQGGTDFSIGLNETISFDSGDPPVLPPSPPPTDGSPTTPFPDFGDILDDIFNFFGGRGGEIGDSQNQPITTSVVLNPAFLPSDSGEDNLSPEFDDAQGVISGIPSSPEENGEGGLLDSFIKKPENLALAAIGGVAILAGVLKR